MSRGLLRERGASFWPAPRKLIHMLSLEYGLMGGREMIRKRFTPEQIIGKLREAEVALAQGQTVVQAGQLSKF